MVSKANLVVSFAALLSAWIVGFAAARFFGWGFSSLSFNPASPLELLWLGFAALVFGMMFFGRLGFLFFFALGAIQSTDVSWAALVPLFFRALVLAWFGMLGTHLGEMLFEDLREKREFEFLEKKVVWLFVIGIFLAVIIALLSSTLNKLGENLVDFARKVRNREFTLDNILDFFKPTDWNQLPDQNQFGNR